MNTTIRVIAFLTLIVMTAIVLVSCSVSANGFNASETIMMENSEPGDGNKGDEEYKDLYFPEKGTSGLIGFAEFGDVFAHNISELYNKADLIIMGTVIDDNTQLRVGESQLETALSEVQIEEIWKGSAGVDDTVTVLETGWRFDNGTSASIGGEPILQNGMKVILFLGSPYNGTRAIINSFQGKFILDPDGILYTYRYYSNEYEAGFLDDIGETVPLGELESTLDGLSER